jgi:hypothetical protein
MSQQNPYEVLGVSENTPFDRIQAAKEQAVQQCNGNQKLLDNIETAYDAILMERLKLRQQGKITVPESVRFPDKPQNTIPRFNPPSIPNSSGWLANTFETPTRSILLTTTGVYTLLGASLLLPGAATQGLAAIVAFGTAFSLYTINKKGRRFKQAFLGSFFALIGGMVIGGIATSYLPLPLDNIALPAEAFTLATLWGVATFTK